jgi:single-strand DNA-binding protein
MTDMITITGLVGTIPRHLVTAEGLPITSFRLASTQRRFDRAHERWVDGETNWYTITAFRHLAVNIAGSIKKGERVLVTGKLRIRDWEAGEKTGTNIEVDADAIGHDLSWGTASFMRSIAAVVAAGETGSAASAGDGSSHELTAAEAELPDAMAATAMATSAAATSAVATTDAWATVGEAHGSADPVVDTVEAPF